jgi:RimJ/RimL family protein N-acetyltransferase
VNLECKLLLLEFCFEELNAIRVQLKTDENNIRSQKAIRKIGAQYEGVLRNDWIRDNGTIRNSVYFSIISSEWKEVNIKLLALLNEKLNEQNN